MTIVQIAKFLYSSGISSEIDCDNMNTVIPKSTTKNIIFKVKK